MICSRKKIKQNSDTALIFNGIGRLYLDQAEVDSAYKEFINALISDSEYFGLYNINVHTDLKWLATACLDK